MSDHEGRIGKLEEHVETLREQFVHLDRRLDENTRVTESIKSDTSEIVDLMKGGKILGRLATWFAAIIGGYLAGKGLKWW